MASLKMNTAFTPPHVDEVAIFAPYKYSQIFIQLDIAARNGSISCCDVFFMSLCLMIK